MERGLQDLMAIDSAFVQCFGDVEQSYRGLEYSDVLSVSLDYR